jgi:hypothetical protein
VAASGNKRGEIMLLLLLIALLLISFAVFSEVAAPTNSAPSIANAYRRSTDPGMPISLTDCLIAKLDHRHIDN